MKWYNISFKLIKKLKAKLNKIEKENFNPHQFSF